MKKLLIILLLTCISGELFSQAGTVPNYLDSYRLLGRLKSQNGFHRLVYNVEDKEFMVFRPDNTWFIMKPISDSLSADYLGSSFLVANNMDINYLSRKGTSGNFVNSGLYDNGTYIGIGTTTPTQPLTIKRNPIASDYTLANFNSGIAGTGAESIILFTNSIDGTGIEGSAEIAVRREAGNTGNILFKTSNGTERSIAMRITGDNFVGINTSGYPTHELEVNGTARVTGLMVNTGTDTGEEAIVSGTTKTRALKVTDLSVNYLPKGGTDGLLGNSRIIDDGTNVGIGTVSPTALLELRKVGSPSDMFKISSTGGGEFRIGAENNTSNPEWRIGTNGGESLAFEVGANASAFYINSGGNVGIGTKSPSTKLHVEGTTRTTNLTVTSLGTGYLPKIGAGGAFQNSLIYDSFFNIGVGTALPTHKLHVDGTTRTNTLLVNTAVYDNSLAAEITGTTRTTNLAVTALTTNYLPKIGAAGLLGNSSIFDNGTNVGIGTEGGVGKFEVFAGTLGTAVNSELKILRLTSSLSNASVLEVSQNRHTSGSDWTSSTTYFRHRIDATNLGYLAFNPLGDIGGIAFGSGFDSSENMRITADGKVGIGTTSPTAKLHVNGTTRTDKLLVNTAVDNGLDVAQFNGSISSTSLKVTELATAKYFRTLSNNTESNLLTRDNLESALYVQNSNVGGDLLHLLNGSAAVNNGTSRFIVKGNGNVGIGNVNPAFKVHVNGTGYFSGGIIGGLNYSMGDNNNAVIDLHQNSNDFYVANFRNGGGNGKGVNIRVGGTSSNSIPFRVARNDDTELFRIIGNGNVGIGTTAPLFSLDVRGNSPFSYNRPSIGGSSPDLLSYGYMLIPQDGGPFFDMIRSSNTSLRFATETSYGTGFSTQMTLTQNGNVGIGTTTPNSKLEVTGDVRITNATDGILMKTPDGLNTYRITIDNSGNIVTTAL
jgi:hypothetical protein